MDYANMSKAEKEAAAAASAEHFQRTVRASIRRGARGLLIAWALFLLGMVVLAIVLLAVFVH